LPTNKKYKINLVYMPYGIPMLLEMTDIIGLPVYTPEGILLGNVNNVIVDVEGAKIDSLFLAETNPTLIKGSKAIAFPYRWVQAVGDVIILKYFPKKISLVEKGKEEEEKEE